MTSPALIAYTPDGKETNAPLCIGDDEIVVDVLTSE